MHASFLHSQSGVIEAIKPFAENADVDVRISDAARGCLLQLGQLQDKAAGGCLYDAYASCVCIRCMVLSLRPL